LLIFFVQIVIFILPTIFKFNFEFKFVYIWFLKIGSRIILDLMFKLILDQIWFDSNLKLIFTSIIWLCKEKYNCKITPNIDTFSLYIGINTMFLIQIWIKISFDLI